MGDFDQILYSWKGEFEKGHVPVKSNLRIPAYVDLFERFKKAGFEKSYFNVMVKGKIVTASLNPNHPRRKKLTWAECANGDLKMALHTVFTDAVPQEVGPLDSETDFESLKDVDIEDQIETHNEKITKHEPKQPKIVHDADSEGPPMESANEIDPVMAKLMGIKIK